jgi:hypothetical protein
MTTFTVKIQILISQNIFHIINLRFHIINLYEIREVFSVFRFYTIERFHIINLYNIRVSKKKQYNIKETLIECFFKKKLHKKNSLG